MTRRAREPLGASNNLLVRRDLLERVGGFDERLGPGTWAESAEDLALFDRLLQPARRAATSRKPLSCMSNGVPGATLVRLDWGYGKGQGARLALREGSTAALAATGCADLLWHDGRRECRPRPARRLRVRCAHHGRTHRRRPRLGYGVRQGRAESRVWMGEDT